MLVYFSLMKGHVRFLFPEIYAERFFANILMFICKVFIHLYSIIKLIFLQKILILYPPPQMSISCPFVTTVPINPKLSYPEYISIKLFKDIYFGFPNHQRIFERKVFSTLKVWLMTHPVSLLIIIAGQNYFYENLSLKAYFPSICHKPHFLIHFKF